MKNIQVFIATVLLLLATIGDLQAHALYIDTDASGKVGEKQDVSVYYSEFEDRAVEKVADWYSDVAAFELWLVQPDGQRLKLNTVAKEDHFVSDFTPNQKGKYRLEISHTAADPGEETAFQFNAFAEVWVGKPTKEKLVTQNLPDLLLTEQTLSKDPKVKTYLTYFKGKPAEGITTTLFLPSGKKKTFTSNAEGAFEINLDEKGTYFLEATSFQKKEAGTTQKAAYESVWRCATQKIEVI